MDEGEIEVLSELEAIRRRPGMYIGGADACGLRHLLFEVVGNVVDLHLARGATELRVVVTPDSWVTIRDDGPGIRLAILERVLTRIHVGATYDGHYPHLHLTDGMRGGGLAVVNALSINVEIETTCDGVRWAQSFERGRPTSTLRRVGASSVDGTLVRFRPDPAIFPSIEYDLDVVRERLQQLAWLNPNLHVWFQEKRLRSRGGLRGWVAELAGKDSVEAMYSACQSLDGVSVDIALGWRSSTETTIRSFVNMHETTAGTHVDGLWQGLANYVWLRGVRDPGQAVRERLAPGLVAILHVGLHGPEWASPTRAHLKTPVAGASVRRILEADLSRAVAHDGRFRQFIDERLGE